MHLRRVLVFAAVAVGLSVALVFYAGAGSEAASGWERLDELEPEGLVQMVICDGSTGGRAVTEDEHVIEEFFHIAQSLKHTEAAQQEPVAGWCYYVDLYSSGDAFLRLTFAGRHLVFDEMKPGCNSLRRVGPRYEVSIDVVPDIASLYDQID